MALSDWLLRLESLSAREIDLGLERVEQVLDRLSLHLPDTVIHVAGTNGKGSCVAMLEALLGKAGVRVGCYTSPHIDRYNERISVGRKEAGDETIVAAFEQIEAVRDGVPLTYFEYGTIAALVVFADAGVDVTILEVGMGGRLDAVNAVEPGAGIISNVSLDHCDWLGNDVETIAVEKAGIMRANTPLVFGSRDLPAAIVAQAEAIGARLLAAGRDFDWSGGADGWSWQGVEHRLIGLHAPALKGAHQIANAAAVLTVLESCGYEELLDTTVVNDALGGLQLPGRLQEIDGDSRWLLDVAHNPAAAEVLADALRSGPARGTTVAIFGLLDDKDLQGIVTALAREVDEWIAVTADSPRAIPASELSRQLANITNSACLIAESMQQAMAHAQVITTAEDRILVTGSFFVVGPALRLYSPRTS